MGIWVAVSGMKAALKRPAVLAMAMALGGCSWLWGDERIAAPYVGATAVTVPSPAVRVLVTSDRRDPAARALHSIELVAPDGARHAPGADGLVTSTQPYSYTTAPSVVGETGATSVPENFGLATPAARRGELVSVSALIPIDDIDAYRQGYRRWTVEVVFSGVEGRRITVPAPPIAP